MLTSSIRALPRARGDSSGRVSARWLMRTAVAGVLGADTFCAMSSPWSRPGALALTLVLAFPPMLASLLLLGALRRGLIKAGLRPLIRKITAPELQLAAVTAGAILLAGFYLSNRFLVGSPTAAVTIRAYELSMLIALASMF